MELSDDIKKVTSLPSVDHDTKFFRLQGLSQAEKDRKMNKKKVKRPRNIELLEDANDEIDDSNTDDIYNKVKPTFDRNAISAAIKEVNGGLNLSNKHWEKYWLTHLEDISNSENKKLERSFICNSDKIYSENKTEIKNFKDKLINQNYKILRNAAIMGLVNIKKILLEDLLSPYDIISIRKDKSKAMPGIASNDDTKTDNKYQAKLVSLRDDPEVLVHPLRMGLNRNKFKDTDFTASHIGIKIKETPQQYFLRTTNDDSFVFVKKKRL